MENCFALHLGQDSDGEEIPHPQGRGRAWEAKPNLEMRLIPAERQQVLATWYFDGCSLLSSCSLGPWRWRVGGGVRRLYEVGERGEKGFPPFDTSGPSDKQTRSVFIGLPPSPSTPSSAPSLSLGAEDRTQRNLCLSCTGRAQTNRGLLWPLISRSYAAPVPLQEPD